MQERAYGGNGGDTENQPSAVVWPTDEIIDIIDEITALTVSDDTENRLIM